MIGVRLVVTRGDLFLPSLLLFCVTPLCVDSSFILFVCLLNIWCSSLSPPVSRYLRSIQNQFPSNFPLKEDCLKKKRKNPDVGRFKRFNHGHTWTRVATLLIIKTLTNLKTKPPQQRLPMVWTTSTQQGRLPAHSKVANRCFGVCNDGQLTESTTVTKVRGYDAEYWGTLSNTGGMLVIATRASAW